MLRTDFLTLIVFDVLKSTTVIAFLIEQNQFLHPCSTNSLFGLFGLKSNPILGPIQSQSLQYIYIYIWFLFLGPTVFPLSLLPSLFKYLHYQWPLASLSFFYFYYFLFIFLFLFVLWCLCFGFGMGFLVSLVVGFNGSGGGFGGVEWWWQDAS